MYLLDTNVVSELRKSRAVIDRNVAAWIAGHDVTALHLSAFTVLELEVGVRRVERRDSQQGRNLRRWLDRVQGEFDGRIVPFDAAAARVAASLQVPDPSPDHDCFIAATALTRGLTVVTRNTKDFVRTGVPLVDPWQ